MPPASNATGLLIFVVTYALISARRLQWLGFDRPAGALLGAVACVVFRVLGPAEALGAVNGETLLLLFGVMGMGAFLAIDGFFDGVEAWASALAKTPSRLLGLVVWCSGLLSAFITNDAVCVLGAPVIIRIIKRNDLPALPFLLALATSANTGSVATLVGNPQNMLCGTLGGLDYLGHLAYAGPVAIAGLAVNHGVLHASFRRHIAAAVLARTQTDSRFGIRTTIDLVVIGATALVYAMGADLAWTATAGFVALMLVHRRDTRQLWNRIEWSLLLFFGGLFVVVAGLMHSGAPALFFARFPLAAGVRGFIGWLRLAAIFLIGSNVVSNVPFILVVREQMATLSDPRFGWELLAMASTFAGNLTLLGSVANIIVAESARAVGGIGFFQYLRVGLPVAVLTTIIGVVWMFLVGHPAY